MVILIIFFVRNKSILSYCEGIVSFIFVFNFIMESEEYKIEVKYLRSLFNWCILSFFFLFFEKSLV